MANTQSTAPTTIPSAGSHDEASSSTTTAETKILWFCQSNVNSGDETEQQQQQQQQWKRYSDFENDFIENAFQQNEQEVQLNGYKINFELRKQIKLENQSDVRLVKREEVNRSEFIREERFSNPEEAITSFDNRSHDNTYWLRWWKNRSGMTQSDGNDNWEAIAKKAAEGILQEGQQLDQAFDAQQMAQQLRNFTSKEELLKCSVRLYSAESFLRKLFNTTLNNKDFSKLTTLGPMAYLLHQFTRENSSGSGVGTLYRGMTLTDQMIEEYKKRPFMRGRSFIWIAPALTTRNRQIAERFGVNTVFILSVKYRSMDSTADISSVSRYPDEQEELIEAQSSWKVVKVECDPESGKHLIYVESDSLFIDMSWHDDRHHRYDYRYNSGDYPDDHPDGFPACSIKKGLND